MGIISSLLKLGNFASRKGAVQTIQQDCVSSSFSACDDGDYSIESIMRDRRIVTRWQPICSVKKRTIVGVEALSRAVRPNGDIIGPDRLFSRAQDEGRTLELDRLCRTCAIESFSEVSSHISETTLFINVDTSILGKTVVGSGHLRAAVARAGLDPHQIVIEIIESRTDDIGALKDFIDIHRSQGFLIALDDVGVGHSNLDRIAFLKPDLLKIDRGIVMAIHEHHAREVFRALTGLAHTTGSLVVAEGLEEEDQVYRVLELGADLLQGFFFAKPQSVGSDLLPGVEKKMRGIAQHFRERILRSITARTDLYNDCQQIAADCLQYLETCTNQDFNTVLAKAVTLHPSVQFAYILTGSGIQVSDTIGALPTDAKGGHFLFEPAAPGADHALKDYILVLSSGRDNCLTDPYISLATGEMCRTFSIRFTGCDGCDYILCLDFDLGEC